MIPIVDVVITHRFMDIGIQRKLCRRSKICCTFLVQCLIPHFMSARAGNHVRTPAHSQHWGTTQICPNGNWQLDRSVIGNNLIPEDRPTTSGHMLPWGCLLYMIWASVDHLGDFFHFWALHYLNLQTAGSLRSLLCRLHLTKLFLELRKAHTRGDRLWKKEKQLMRL